MAAISQLSGADRPLAISTIVAAFAADPVERWLWPAEDVYNANFPDFAAAFAGDAVEQGTCWRVTGKSAVALWLPPGVEPAEDTIVSILTKSVPVEKHEDLFSTLEQMTAIHPNYSHWYLPWLAVAPRLQGRGLGGLLLEHGLAIVDGDGLPAFLDTPNPRTVSLYERYGFEVVGSSHSGSCPPMTSMLRVAR